jgi:hypothetical protein
MLWMLEPGHLAHRPVQLPWEAASAPSAAACFAPGGRLFVGEWSIAAETDRTAGRPPGACERILDVEDHTVVSLQASGPYSACQIGPSASCWCQ